MLRLARVCVLVAAIGLTGCESPADSPECTEWQKETLKLSNLMGFATDDSARARDMALASTINDRPDGCPIPW